MNGLISIILLPAALIIIFLSIWFFSVKIVSPLYRLLSHRIMTNLPSAEKEEIASVKDYELHGQGRRDKPEGLLLAPPSRRITPTKLVALVIFIINGLPILVAGPFFMVAIMAFDAPGSTSEPIAYLPFIIVLSYFATYPLCVINAWQQLKAKRKIGWITASVPFIYTMPVAIWYFELY